MYDEQRITVCVKRGGTAELMCPLHGDDDGVEFRYGIRVLYRRVVISDRYSVHITQEFITLRVNNVSAQDDGVYTCAGASGGKIKRRFVLIVVEGNGTVSLIQQDSQVFSPFDAHCCHMDTAIKHPVPDRVKLSFVIFDIWAL